MSAANPYEFKSIIELITYFNTEERCLAYLEQQRWNGKPVCPHCEADKVYRFSDGRRFKCATCKKQFTAKVGTYFESSKLPLQKWFMAIYLITAHKKGISSHQLSRDLNITQKTAWFVLHRVRTCFGVGETLEEYNKIGGEGEIVEVDETYIGGKLSNKHKQVRADNAKRKMSRVENKTGVMAMLQRDGIVRTTVMRGGYTIKQLVEQKVDKGSILMTDSYPAYQGLNKVYKLHKVVNHDKNEYVRGKIHTNTVEGFFGILKRGIFGIYHQVSPKHLHRYCYEFAFRYNSRDMKDGSRMNIAMTMCGAPLKYRTLIQK